MRECEGGMRECERGMRECELGIWELIEECEAMRQRDEMGSEKEESKN